MPEYDRSVTVTSDGVVTVVRSDGTEGRVALLRPMLHTQLRAVHPEHLDLRGMAADGILPPPDPSWTFTATSAQPAMSDRP